MRRLLSMLRQGVSFAPICTTIYLLINILRATAVVYTQEILANLINSTADRIQGNGTFQDVFPGLVMFGVLTLAVWILVSLRFRLSDDVLPVYSKCGADRYMMKQMEFIPLKQFDNSAFCDALEKYRAGLNRLPEFVKHMMGIITAAYTLVLTCVKFGRIHWSFCLVLVSFTVLAYVGTRKNASVKDDLRKKLVPLQRREDYLFSMSDGVYNRETRLYDAQDRYSEKLYALQDEMADMDFAAGRKIARKEAAAEFLKTGLCPLVNLAIAVFLVLRGQMDIGSVFLVWSLSSLAMSGSGGLISSIVESGTFMLEFEDVERFEQGLDKDKKAEAVSEQEEAPVLNVDHVSFSYLPDAVVLNDITLHMRKGETIAILGENGSGKSTLIKLLLGFYQPDKGSVTLNGHELYQCPETYIRANFGVTFQDYCQFPATIRENVGFGDVEHIQSDDHIMEAINKADCRSILEKSHDRLDAMLGRELDDGGIELSGGEWQRIALARMYVSPKNIMILDEPAAKLDPLAEVRQFEQVRKYAAGRLLIMVSHRVGFARLADRIIVMKNGRIAEQGSHEALMSQKGIYYEMFSVQKRMYEQQEGEQA